MSKILLATAAFALVAAAVPSHAQQATTKDQLIGRTEAIADCLSRYPIHPWRLRLTPA
jgi:hypothetical protein